MKSEGQQRALKQADCYISKGDAEVLIQGGREASKTIGLLHHNKLACPSDQQPEQALKLQGPFMQAAKILKTYCCSF